MPVLVLLSVVGVAMLQCMIWNQNEMHKLSKVKNGRKYASYNKQFFFSDKIFFSDTSLTVSKIPDMSVTAVKIPDISRFSRQVVTLTKVIPIINNQSEGMSDKSFDIFS